MSDSIQDGVPSSREEMSDEIFKRMVINDAKQNQLLKSKLSKGSSGSYAVNKSKKQKVEKSSGMRFVVVTLGVISLAMSQMSRGVINYCITSMVDPRMLHKASSPLPENITDLPTLPFTTMDGGASGMDDETTTGGYPESSNYQETPSAYDPILFYMTTESVNEQTTTDGFASNTIMDDLTTPAGDAMDSGTSTVADVATDSWDMTTMTDATTTDSLATSTSIAETTTATYQPVVDPDAPLEDKFMWTIKEQSLIKGGFYYSYFFFMILGGRMSEMYGAKYVLLLGVAGSALINLATPWMARNSLFMLITSRIIMGAIQSGVFPAMYALINKWLTMSEASIYAPMIKMSLRLGQLLSSLVPGLIPDWAGSFYVVGALGTLWSILWLTISTSEPATNRWVTKTELAHIMKKKRKPGAQEEVQVDASRGMDMTVIKIANNNEQQVAVESKRPASGKKTPWIKIITSPSVIGLIVVKLSFNFCSDFLTVELPSYLRYVHSASRQRLSAITTAMYAIQVSFIILAGWLAKVMIKRRPFNMSKTHVRKLFQSLANIGGGFFLFMITLGDCGLTEATILLQLVSIASVFSAGGETMLPYDLSDEYPATIMAIANSVANLSGITVTTLTGFVLGDQGGSKSRWNTVIVLIAGAEMLGGLAFCHFVKAEPIDFESKSKSKSKQNKLANAENGQSPSYESSSAEVTQEKGPEKLKSDNNDNNNNNNNLGQNGITTEGGQVKVVE